MIVRCPAREARSYVVGESVSSGREKDEGAVRPQSALLAARTGTFATYSHAQVFPQSPYTG